MNDDPQKVCAERVLAVDTVIGIAIQTLTRQFNLSEADASVALGSRIVDILVEVAPHTAKRFFETRADVKLHQLKGDRTESGNRAAAKSINSHMRAVDRFFDEGNARFEKLRGRQN